MKFKLLKQIEQDNSLPIGAIFEDRNGVVTLANDLKVSSQNLVDQGFIEPIPGIPEFKVGEPVVYLEKDTGKALYYARVLSVYTTEINEANPSGFTYDYISSKYLRKPTAEELKNFFQ